MATPNYVNTSLGLLSISKEVTAGLPNWSFTASGGSGTTITVDTTDSATDDNNIDSLLPGAVADFFNGAQVYFLASTPTAALQGKVYEITDFATVTPTATFTTPTMAATPANNDLFYVLWPLPASNVSINASTENLERDFVRQTLDKPSALKGLKVADGSFDVEIPGMTTASTAIAPAPVDRFSALLSVVGARRSVEGEAIVAGTLGVSTCSVTNASTFAVDDMVLINNEVRRVTVVDTAAVPNDLLTWAPALSSAPIATDVIYGGEQWEAADETHQTLTILHVTDDRLVECRGAACSVKLSAEFGGVLAGSVEFSAAYMASGGAESGWDLQDSFTVDGSQSSKKPPVFKTSAAHHFSGTSVAVSSWEFDLGHERAEHRYVDTHYFTITARNATCAVNFKDTSVVPKETWEASGTVGELLMAAGKSVTDCVAVSGQAQLYDPASSAENNGFLDWNATFAYCDDQTDAANAKRPMIVRF